MPRKRLSKHDKKVKNIARGYKGRGYKVSASLPDYRKPRKIRGRVPDVIAKKRRKTIIVEVETSKSFAKDRKQRKLLRDYARKKKRVKFRTTRA